MPISLWKGPPFLQLKSTSFLKRVATTAVTTKETARKMEANLTKLSDDYSPELQPEKKRAAARRKMKRNTRAKGRSTRRSTARTTMISSRKIIYSKNIWIRLKKIPPKILETSVK